MRSTFPKCVCDQIQLSPSPRTPFLRNVVPLESTPTWALAYSSMLLVLNAQKRSRFHQTPQNRIERVERERERERAGERKDGWEIGESWGFGVLDPR